MYGLKGNRSGLSRGGSRLSCILRMCAIGCFLVAGFSQNPAHAAPFLLSEDNDGSDTLPAEFGDLPVFLDGVSTPFPVDIGTNVITGNHACLFVGCGALPQNQVDVFRIEVPVGISVINTFISTGDVLTTHEFRLTTLGGAPSFIFIGFVGGPVGVNITDELTPGIYDLYVGMAGNTVGTDWRMEFLADTFTAPIPEPSTLLLLGFGLAGLGFMRQRASEAIHPV